MQGQTNKKIIKKKLPQRLRKECTDAERALWNLLRDRRFSSLKFRRQHPFDGYILDFVCLEAKLVIEVDGGQHARQKEYDSLRTEKLTAAGFTTVRFWNDEVLQQTESVKEKIWLITHPHPCPPLEGEGVVREG